MQSCALEKKGPASLEMVETATAAFLLGISERDVQRKINNGVIASHTLMGVRGRSGMNYLIPITALPPEAQMRWRAMQAGASQADLASYTAKKAAAAVDRAKLTKRIRAEEKRLREEAAREALAALQEKADAMEELKRLTGRRGGVMEAKQAIADRLGVGLRQLYEYQKAYEEGGIEGLMDRTERKDKGQPRTMCLMAQDYIKAQYLTSGKVRQNVVCDNVKKLAKALGCGACDICPHNPGSLCRAEMVAKGQADPYTECRQAGDGIIPPAGRHTVNRFIREIPEGEKSASRLGWAYWDAHHMPKVKRDKPEKANEVWFGDHHVFDLFVNYQGKPVRPWLTAFTDAKSNAMPGWVISLGPNSETIMECLATAIAKTEGSPYWGMPEMLYIDNGKDYRCRRIEGDGKRLTVEELGKLNLDFDGDNALLRTLGIGVTHAIPYRAWSKTIERIFGTIEPRWIRGLPGYCENDIEVRPEHLNEDIRKGRLLTFEEFVALWATKIWPEYNSFCAEGAEASPLEIYQASEKARTEVVSWHTLAIAKSLRAERKVTTTGVSLNRKTYQHPALALLIGKRVTLLYTRQEIGSVTVMLDGAFVCEAPEAETFKLVGEDPERLAEHMKFQQETKRAVREALRLPAERVRMLGTMACEIPEAVTNASITSLVHERAYRGQQEGRARIQERKEAKTAAARVAKGRLRAKCIAEGDRLLRGGAESDQDF